MNYITNEIRNDGFGAQYQSIIGTILYAELNNYEYIYTPPDFKTVYEDEEEIQKLKSIMNLENNFKTITDLSSDTKINIFPAINGVNYINNNIDTCLNSESIKKIKNIFKSNKQQKYFDENNFNVAIHIRRSSLHKNIDLASHHGNIDVKSIKDLQYLSSVNPRFTEDSYFLNLISSIRKKHNNAKFHIYSEGYIEDFSSFIKDDIILHLNEPVFDTFTSLVFGDMLIMSASSFSYVAGLLSDNIVIFYSKFWASKASNWLVTY